MKKILINIDDNEKDILDQFVEAGIGQSKVVRSLLSLIKSPDDDVTFIAVNKSDVTIVNGYSGDGISTANDNVKDVDIEIRYSDGEITKKSIDCTRSFANDKR